MISPEVSVVMGVYNGAEHLEQTLDSVLSQEGCDLEFVVVDDGSTDDTGRILDEWAAKDARLRVIHQQNTGLTRALIRGCAEAHGEFIARQDAGDVSLAGRLQEQSAVLRNNESLAIVSCWTRYVGPDGEFLYEHSGSGVAKWPVDIIDLRQHHCVLDGPSHHGSVMFRRDNYFQAGCYRAQFYFAQDWDLWYRIGMTGKFQMLQSTLYEARIGLGDISTCNKHSQEGLALLSLQSLKLRVAGLSDAGVLDKANQIRPRGSRNSSRGNISHGSYFIGECLRRNGSVVKARYCFWQTIKDNPLHLKAWVRLVQSVLAKHS
jgi:glycosyltransferase involved in cell wall biosynthesis